MTAERSTDTEKPAMAAISHTAPRQRAVRGNFPSRRIRQAAPTQPTRMERCSPETTRRWRIPARLIWSSSSWSSRSPREKTMAATTPEAAPGLSS